MGSISRERPWLAAAQAGFVNLPLLGTACALVTADHYAAVPFAGSAAAVPLGIALARVIRAAERSRDVRIFMNHRDRDVEVNEVVTGTAVREDAVPVVLEEATPASTAREP